jgi:hypothetical protein
MRQSPATSGLHISSCVLLTARRVCKTVLDDDNHTHEPHMTSASLKEKFTFTILDAVRCLPNSKQAAILLDTSLALIEAGQYGVSRLLSVSCFNFLPCADMDPKSKNFSKFISRRRGYRKRM